MSATANRSRLSKAALAIGFGTLLVGTLAAYRAPARGYELSIYAGTPVAYWLGLSVAIAVSLAVSSGRRASSLLRSGGMFLGGTAVSTLVLLPLIRGYFLFGTGDSLTHLGWTRDIVAGRLDPFDMLYPGIHTMTIFVGRMLGTRFGRAQLFVTFVFILVFIVFVAFCVRELGNATWAVPVGLFSALLILPNNNVSVHLMAHPITQTLFFFPLVLYLVFAYVTSGTGPRSREVSGTPIGVLLVLSVASSILIHPQGALNIIAVLVAAVTFQFFLRQYSEDGPISDHRPLYSPTAVSIVAYAAWAPRHERVHGTASFVVDRILQGSVAADEVTQRSTSLTEIGGSTFELFTKLFLVQTLFGLIAAALVVVWYTGRLDGTFQRGTALLTYPVVALIPLSGAFLVFFLSSMTTQHFRYIGFLMVPITILGAVGISEGAGRLRRRLSDTQVRAALVVCFLLLAPMPLATAHASPIIYQPTQNAPVQHVEGIETTVAQMDRDIEFAGIRGGPERYLEGIYGTRGVSTVGLSETGPRSSIPGTVFETNLTSYYETQRYVPVTDADYQREVRLYDGFRYSKRGFRRLDTTPGIDRVQSNGVYRLYLVGNRTTA